MAVQPVRSLQGDAAWASRPEAEPAGSPRLTVEICAGLAGVEDAWRKLERSGVCSPYQRFDWISTYVATMVAQEGASVCVLTIGQKGSEPLFILPLAVGARHGVRVASPIGGKQANYHCPVMQWGAAAVLSPETMRALLGEAGARAGIDIFAFQDLPLAWDGERNPLVLGGATPSPSSAPKTSLPPDPDMLLAQIGTSEARRKLRKQEAGLAALGELTYCLARNSTEVDAILDAFFRQKNERFRDLGITSPFDDEASRAFIRAGCLAGLEQGRPAIELHGLALDGRFIATYGGAVDAQRFSCMFNSFDASPGIARFSPGNVLVAKLIRTQCDLRRTTLDLGIGDARYKRLFCKDTEELVDVFLPVTVMGRLYGLALEQLVTAKRYVKQTPALWSCVQAMRSGRSKLGI